MLRRIITLILFPALACILICVHAAAQDEEVENGDRMLWAAGKVSKYVGLTADHAVSTEFFSSKKRMKEVMRMFFRRNYPEDKYWAMNAVMLKFGFSLFDDDSEEEIIEDYTKGILGVYDDDEKKIYVVESKLYQELRDERYEECNVDYMYAQDPVWKDWWNRNRTDIVLVHEATHALQDMHFDLYDWHNKYEWNDDAHLAIKSMIEGQAELVELKYTLEALNLTDYNSIFYRYGDSWDMRLFAKIDEYIEDGREDFGTCEDPMTFMWWLGNVPYIFGKIFMRKIEGEQNIERTNDAFVKCPLSSEQVMNSDKYFSEKDEDRPTFIDFPSFDDLIDIHEWRFLDYNSMGQLKLYLLCRDLYYDPEDECHPMAEGWDGDRYIVWRDEDDDIFLSWYTTWDNPRDAREFYNFYFNARTRRAGSGGSKKTGDNFKLILDEEDSMYIEIRDTDVIIIEGSLLEENGYEDYADRMWESELYEASYDICTMTAEEFDDEYVGFTSSHDYEDEDSAEDESPDSDEDAEDTEDDEI